MKRLQRIVRKGERGMALMYAAMVAMIAAGLTTFMLDVTTSSSRQAEVKRYRTYTHYLAEGAIEASKKYIQTQIANWAAPVLDVPQVVTIEGNNVNYTISQPTPQWIATQPNGIQTIINQYQILATATINGYTASSRRIINAEATPIFQFAVFYTNDLEILPGANMTLGGRVHSNSDMYLGSNATLTVNTNYLRSVGEIYRNRKDDPGTSPGTVKVRKWVEDPFDGSEPVSYVNMNSKSQMQSYGVSTESGYDDRFTAGYDKNLDGDFVDPGDFLPWASGSLSYWGPPDGYSVPSDITDPYTVMTSDHGITEAVTPQIGSIKMYDQIDSGSGGDFNWDASQGKYVPADPPGTGTHNKGFFHGNADLTVLLNPDGTFEAHDKNGVNIPMSSFPLDTFKKQQKVYDARQAGGSSTKIWTVDVDIAKLNTSSKFPSNGLLYVAQYGEGTGLSAKGIRLKNGSLLHAKLTVVSEDPIYIQGDYNTNTKKGAAVIGDAINLLSNAWNDSKTKGNLPNATATTYNVAMISGNQDTGVGNYNGGLENLPRFHENWTGIACNIYGSFVNTWLSQYATGAWVYGGDRYTAPNRNWFYDTAFNNVANLPPFTPMAVSAVDIVSWE